MPAKTKPDHISNEDLRFVASLLRDIGLDRVSEDEQSAAHRVASFLETLPTAPA